MKARPLIWMMVSITFEALGDVLAKLGIGSTWFMAAALVAYNVTMIAWLMVVKTDTRITVPGSIWCLSGQVAICLVGVIIFHERLSACQSAGAVFAALAIWLLCL